MASDRTELRQRFRDVVTTEEALRAVLGRPKQRTVDKVVTSLDETSRRFIARSPFLLISSVMEGGLVDVSPKGDPAGFVRVLDDTTLAIPDRLGNRRGDTMMNILRNPNVGLIFLIPGVTHTLRVSGKASIVRDTELRQNLAFDRAPVCAEIERAALVGLEVVGHQPLLDEMGLRQRAPDLLRRMRYQPLDDDGVRFGPIAHWSILLRRSSRSSNRSSQNAPYLPIQPASGFSACWLAL